MITKAVTTYIKGLKRAYRDRFRKIINLSEYKIALTESLVNAESSLNTTNGLSAPCINVRKDFKKHVKKFKEHIVTSSADKAHQAFAFMCKTLYAQWITNEVTRPDSAYTLVHESEATIVARIANWINTHRYLRCSVGKLKIATLKLTAKYHKKNYKKDGTLPLLTLQLLTWQSASIFSSLN